MGSTEPRQIEVIKRISFGDRKDQDEHIAFPVIRAEVDALSMSLSATMIKSVGQDKLSPVAVQWNLKIVISINNTKCTFDVVENLLRSFLAGSYCKRSHMRAYEQIESGFIVEFAPPALPDMQSKTRSEIKAVHVNVDLHVRDDNVGAAFEALLKAINVGFQDLAQQLSHTAPLVFDDTARQKVGALAQLIRPLNSSLRLDFSGEIVDRFVEHALIADLESRVRNFFTQGALQKPTDASSLSYPISTRIKNRSDQGRREELFDDTYFAFVSFKQRKFVVLTDYGEDVHEPFFLMSSAR